MAISNKDCDLLFYAKSIGVSFLSTLMLGRLKLQVADSHVKDCLSKYQGVISVAKSDFNHSEYAESLFQALGGEEIQSIDYSNYEGATVIYDMNNPAPRQFYSKYSCIVDGGTLEHIFNFPVAVKNCMEMLKVGGHFIGVSPANNQMGHGFYQFSPELYYRVFSKENGFRVKKMFITSIDSSGDWFEVADPAQVKSRVMLNGGRAVSLAVIAEKISDEDIFKMPPLQSDYENIWSVTASLESNVQMQGDSKAMFFYRRYFPKSLKRAVHFLYRAIFARKAESNELGIYNSRHFRKVEI